jgi:hypothetical protein
VTVDAPRVIAAGYIADHVVATADVNRGRADITARASAYGAAVTARGPVTIPAGSRPLAYDLKGEVRNVDLRRLPKSLNVPAAATNVQAAYQVVGKARNVRVDATFRDSTIAGASIAFGIADHGIDE